MATLPRSKLSLYTQEIGWSGIEHYSGYIRNVDFNPKFSALTSSLPVFDKMYRSDSQIRSIMRMMILPIASAEWDVYGSDKRTLKFVRDQLFESSSRVNFKEFLLQAGLHLVYGFAPFEKVWEVYEGELVLEKACYRKPTSVETWEFWPGTDILTGMKQIAPRRDGEYLVYREEIEPIPRQKMVLFINEPEGASPEGTSAIRAAYAPWYLKDVIQRILGIHIERWGAGIPRTTIAREVLDDPMMDRAEQSLESLRSHEKAGIINIKDEYETDMMPMPGGNMAEQIILALEYFDNQIAKGVLGQFSNMGTAHTGGQASSEVLRDLFITGVQCVADYMGSVIEREIVANIVGFNFQRKKVPKVSVSNLMMDLRAEKFINSITQAIQSQALPPGKDIEKLIRQFVRAQPSEEEEKDGSPRKNPNDSADAHPLQGEV